MTWGSLSQDKVKNIMCTFKHFKTFDCVQVEDEIQTLSQVLAAKEKQLADIKRKLGITPLNELKQNITKTWQEVTTSNA